MIMDRKYDVKKIKEKVESVIRGDSPLWGTFLEYGCKKTAESMVEKLKKEGVNCFSKKSIYGKRVYNVVFTDIVELKKNPKKDTTMSKDKAEEKAHGKATLIYLDTNLNSNNMEEDRLRLLEIALLNDLAELARCLNKLNLSQLERETMKLERLNSRLHEYWSNIKK